MKKKITITLIVAALLSLAGTVEARDSWRGHKGDHSRDHAVVQHRYTHRRKHARRHHNYNHHYRSKQAHYRHKRHHHSFRDGLRFAAGALVLGSVVHAISDYDSRRTSYRSSHSGADRWYRLDADRQCVEVRLNQYGEEIWTYTDARHCY